MQILLPARLIDPRNNMAITPVKSVVMRPMTPRADRDAPKMVPAPALPPSVAARFIRGVGDNFAVGDLHLYDKNDLARWTRSEGGRQRFHVHLISDSTEAVSAILPLAGAPSERWVANSLFPEPKALGLSFSFRHELLLDLVHLDVRNPKMFQTSLLRSPSALVIAPPGGDF